VSGRCFLLAVYFTLSVTACSIGRPIRQATTYLVDPPTKAAIGSTRCPESLRVGNVRVAAPYAGNALVYRLDDVRYVSDPYHAFVADPGDMLGSGIAKWLDQVGPFGSVAQPGSTRPARYVLEATVAELYGDFRERRAPAAVLTMQFALIDQVSTRPKMMYERTIARRVDLPGASPDALARGYGTALAGILSDLAHDLDAHIGH
jgi:cholesterol transport system auxiliary component